jgi:hypothetical protein
MSSISTSSPSWTSLLFVISACNTRPNCYIKEDFKLGFINTPTNSTRAKTQKIIDIFLQSLGTYINQFCGYEDYRMVEQLQTAIQQLTTYIANDTKLQKIERKELTSSTLCKMQKFIERSTPELFLQNIIQESSKSQNGLSDTGIKFIELALDTMNLERVLITDCIIMHMALYMNRIFRKCFTDAGGLIKKDIALNQSPFDWQHMPKLTPEEFSLCLALEQSKVNSEASIRKTVRRITRESPHFAEVPLIKSLSSFLLALSSRHIINFLNHQAFECDLECWEEVEHRPHIFGSISAILNATKIATTSSLSDISDEQLVQMQKHVAKYHEQTAKIDSLYAAVLDLYRKEVSKTKYSSLLQKRILSLNSFTSINIPKINLKRFESQLLENLPLLRKNCIKNDCNHLVYNIFAQHIGYKVQSSEPEVSSSVDETIEKFSHLSIADTPPEEEDDREPTEILPTPIYSQIIEDKIPIQVAHRVRDWQRKHPRILTCDPYLSISEEAKEEAKRLHTFPILISRFLRIYCTPHSWPSKDPKKQNILFIAPGTIECYGKNPIEYEVEYQDCYDKDTNVLYHHFAKKQSFKELLQRCQKASEDLTQIPQNEISDPLQEDLETNSSWNHVSSDSRILVEKRSSTIVVDDTVKMIRYTVAFPNRINE